MHLNCGDQTQLTPHPPPQRVRQTWNKYNLYNLANDRPALNTIRPQTRTFFQQKWAAKRLARGYHGEHIKERAWERMFDRRLLSVVNMEPAYMAKYDGSEQASGRGQGTGMDNELLERQRGVDKWARERGEKKTPYMQMAFAPMERRLDIAVFRALFASSARQARQFCVHGAVKVNGKRVCSGSQSHGSVVTQQRLTDVCFRR